MSGRLTDGGRFDWSIAVLCAVFVGGVFLDGWAHTHGRVDQSFFTPWHAVFYAGYAAVASTILAKLLRNHARGSAWERAFAWSVHLWIGSIVLAGIAGWLLSYLLLPPRSLERETDTASVTGRATPP